MTQVNDNTNPRSGTHLTYEGMCQVILGRLIISIFQALCFCTLLTTALRLLAGLYELGSKNQELNS